MKHQDPGIIQEELDAITSKLNALEVVAEDEFQVGVIRILRVLVQGQIHSTTEFGHLKKAIDLLTVELFKTKDELRHA